MLDQDKELGMNFIPPKTFHKFSCISLLKSLILLLNLDGFFQILPIIFILKDLQILHIILLHLEGFPDYL